MKKRQKKIKPGFSLLEVMLAVFVMTVGIVSVYGLLPRLITTVFSNKDRFIAIQLAQEGVEIVRNFRDGNWLVNRSWNFGLTDCPAPLGCEIDYEASGFTVFADRNLLLNANGFYNYQFGDRTKFKRKIIISSSDWQFSKEMEIRVEVFFSQDGSSYVIINKLFDWI